MSKKIAYVTPVLVGSSALLMAKEETWTWTAFGDAVVAGATAGAVTAALVGEPVGAAAGGVAGAIAGAASYAATQAYHAVVGHK